MRVFIAKRRWRGRYQAYCDDDYVVVAETGTVALGLALEAVPNSEKSEWDLEEIPVDVAMAHWVDSRES